MRYTISGTPDLTKGKHWMEYCVHVHFTTDDLAKLSNYQGVVTLMNSKQDDATEFFYGLAMLIDQLHQQHDPPDGGPVNDTCNRPRY